MASWSSSWQHSPQRASKAVSGTEEMSNPRAGARSSASAPGDSAGGRTLAPLVMSGVPAFEARRGAPCAALAASSGADAAAGAPCSRGTDAEVDAGRGCCEAQGDSPAATDVAGCGRLVGLGRTKTVPGGAGPVTGCSAPFCAAPSPRSASSVRWLIVRVGGAGCAVEGVSGEGCSFESASLVTGPGSSCSGTGGRERATECPGGRRNGDRQQGRGLPARSAAQSLLLALRASMKRAARVWRGLPRVAATGS